MICLQGGAEFGADCIAMDRLLVEAARDAGRTGDIVITALAGASGFEYDTANNNGIRHFSSIVKSVYGNDDAPSVVAAPDARGDEAGAQAGRMRQNGRIWVLLPNDYPVPNTAAGIRAE